MSKQRPQSMQPQMPLPLSPASPPAAPLPTLPNPSRQSVSGYVPTSAPTLNFLSQHPIPRQRIYFGPYILLNTLGEGEFGKVKLGVHSERGDEVAIKLIKRGNVDTVQRVEKVRREISVLKAVHHPNIVNLYDVIETEKYIGIVLEYASGGELFDFILAHKHLKEHDATKLFAQLISGVSYLHAKGIVHRDLKLENLLLDRNKNVIITDFGFANRFAHPGHDLMATSCGSPCYAAPELVVQEGRYVGTSVDVWSCGVILYAMLAGYLPFDDDPNNPDGDNINLLYRYILNTALTFPDWISGNARNLLSLMLVPDPAYRGSLVDVAYHPWLAEYSGLFSRSVADWEEMSDQQARQKRAILEQQRQFLLQQQLAMQNQVAPAPRPVHSLSAGTVPGRHHSALATSSTVPTQLSEFGLPPRGVPAGNVRSIAPPAPGDSASGGAMAPPVAMPAPAPAPASMPVAASAPAVTVPLAPTSTPASAPAFAPLPSVKEKQPLAEVNSESTTGLDLLTPRKRQNTADYTEKNKENVDADLTPKASAKSAVGSLGGHSGGSSKSSGSRVGAASATSGASVASATSATGPAATSAATAAGAVGATGPTATARVPSGAPSVQSTAQSTQSTQATQASHATHSTQAAQSTTYKKGHSAAASVDRFSLRSLLPGAGSPGKKVPSSGASTKESRRISIGSVASIRKTLGGKAEKGEKVPFVSDGAKAPAAPVATSRRQKTMSMQPQARPVAGKVPLPHSETAGDLASRRQSVTAAPRANARGLMNWFKRRSTVAAPTASSQQKARPTAAASAAAGTAPVAPISEHRREKRNSIRPGTTSKRRTAAAAAPVMSSSPVLTTTNEKRPTLDKPLPPLQLQPRAADPRRAQTLSVPAAISVTDAKGVTSPLSSGGSSTFTPSKLRIHEGALDKNALTARPPADVMNELREALWHMGIDMVQESEFKIRGVRRSRKKALSAVSPSGALAVARPDTGASPTPSAASSGLRSFFSRRSYMTASPSSFSLFDSPDPASIAESPSSSAIAHSQPLPVYGEGSTDLGDEVRFYVELTRVKNLMLYYVDIKRMRGGPFSFKHVYHQILNSVDLGSF